MNHLKEEGREENRGNFNRKGKKTAEEEKCWSEEIKKKNKGSGGRKPRRQRTITKKQTLEKETTQNIGHRKGKERKLAGKSFKFKKSSSE
jgi:hypothetical protein